MRLDRTGAPDVGGREGRPAVGSRRGFTLVELLIALVVTGVLASGVIGMLLQQNEFYGRTNDMTFAEQTLRGSADLMSSEIRMSSPWDIVEATGSEFTIRMDLLQSVVCHVDGGQVYVFVTHEVTNANLGSATGSAFRNPYTGGAQYSYNDGFVPNLEKATGKSDVPASTCESNGGPDATDANYTRFRKAAWSGTTPEDGAVVRIYGELTYSFGASGFGSGTAVFREGASKQELASPFTSDASFEYVLDDGSVVTNPATESDVRTVRIQATALGEGSNRYDVDRDLELSIPLRN